MDTGAYLHSVFGLEGKTILVTGAAGGIGSAISRGLASAGGEVALCGRNLEKCRALADEITAAGGRATAHRLDVSDLDSIRACVDEVVRQYGKIDVLFNVAGINKREGLLDVEPETYDRIMDTNLKGVFFMSQAVAREMYRRKSGNIINIGSHNDTGMLGGCSVYGAAKSGVIALLHGGGICPVRHPLQRHQPWPYSHGADPGHLGPPHPGRLPAGADRHGPPRRTGGVGGHRHHAGVRRLLLYDGPGLPCGRRLPLRRQALGIRYPVLTAKAPRLSMRDAT